MTASGTPVAAALAGVVEEVGAATLLVVVASCRPRVVEFVVLRAREEVEVERRVRSTRWRVANARPRTLPRVEAQELSSPGEKGTLHYLEGDTAISCDEVLCRKHAKARCARTRSTG